VKDNSRRLLLTEEEWTSHMKVCDDDGASLGGKNGGGNSGGKTVTKNKGGKSSARGG
jgi:hypothetical protein